MQLLHMARCKPIKYGRALLCEEYRFPKNCTQSQATVAAVTTAANLFQTSALDKEAVLDRGEGLASNQLLT